MSSEHSSSNLRAEVDRLIAEGAFDFAGRRLAELWRRDPGLAGAASIISRLDQFGEKLALTKLKVAILRSFTVEPIVPLVRCAAFSYGIDLAVHVGDFNAYVQEILDASSSPYRFAPDAVVLAVRTAEVAPDLWHQFADLAPGAAQQAAERVVHSYEQWIAAFRERSQAALIIHSLEQPRIPSFGVMDGQSESGQCGLIRQINHELRRIAARYLGVYILDYAALVTRHGSEHWHDERRWLTARLPIATDHLLHMAREWMRFALPLSGRVAKALVVDLDNTLWGGVIGEDGMTGIKVGPEYPEAGYQA